MIKVSDAAANKFKEVAETKESPENLKLRIFMGRAGGAGPQLGVALDERSFGSDVIVESNGARVVYTKDLESFTKKMKIDYSNNWLFKGFRIYGQK